MKKTIYYVPFILFMALYIAVLCIGGLSFDYEVFLIHALFLCAGILLHKHIWLGGLIGSLPGITFIINGTHNIKLGEQEIMIGSCIVLYFAACMIYVFIKKRKEGKWI